jgi:DNA-binding NarL/FixJ family response regulator
MELVTETWQNIRYKYNKEKDTLEEEELGTFTQYPIRLAWAITIHKSQGLTFSKAIIDAGASFAPGQVYVALSRLTGLDGLVLRSRINPDSIRTDERVLQFVESELPDNVLEETLEQEQHTFIQESLLKKFNWVKITEALRSNMQGYMERQIPEIQECISWASGILQTATRQEEVAAKFLRQLERLLAESELKGFSVVHERTEAAVQYFVKEVREGLIASVEKHMSDMQGRDRTKKYMKELAELKRMFERHVHHLNQAAGLTKAMRDNAEMSTLLELAEAMQKPVEISLSVEDVEEKKARRQKGDSHRASLQMFREGKSINDIVRERNLSLTTIETHLASFIITGEVHVTELVSQEKLDKILSMVEKEPNISSWTIKQALGDDVSWGDIRAALNYRDKMAKEGISNME